MIERIFYSMLLLMLGYLLRFGGGLALGGLFVGGIYVDIVKSTAIGLIMIGIAIVGVWLFEIISRRLIAAGRDASPIAVYDE